MSFFQYIHLSQKNVRFIAFIFIFSSILTLGIPKKAEAQWPVFDVPTETGTWATSIFQGSQFSKEFVGDALANYVGKMILQRLTAQTVNWINSGFKGNPAFVTDPNQFFLNVGDSVASSYLSGTSLRNLCSPFKAEVRLALVKSYLKETSDESFSCTLGRIQDNYESFVQNFENGGWESWFIITQNAQNNPYGAYLEAQNSLSVKIGTEQAKYQKQLDWGKGILSFERCTQRATVAASVAPTERRCVEYRPLAIGEPAQCLKYEDEKVDISTDVADDVCLQKETVTPGSVINDQLSKALGSSWASLEASDEINEIVSVLMQQLTSKIVGGISSGLRGLSNRNSSETGTNSRTFLEQMTEAATTDSPEYEKFEAGQKSLVPSDLGGTAPATPPVPPPQAGPIPTDLPIIDVRIVPSIIDPDENSLE